MSVTATRPTVTIRAATNADGERIGWLSWQAGFTIDDLDWSVVEPNWLVAERDGRVIGAVQMCPGRPIGRLELLSIEQSLPHYTKGRVVRALLYAGCRVLRSLGSQFVSGLVVPTREGFCEVLEARGVRKLTTGNIYLMKVR